MVADGEDFDLKAWRPYLRAFDEYLITGSIMARVQMRAELDRNLGHRFNLMDRDHVVSRTKQSRGNAPVIIGA